MSIKCRVESGAEYLDHKVSDWAEKIKLQSFSLASGQSCILGQLFGNYVNGLAQVNLDYGTAFVLGFHQNPNGDRKEGHKEWNQLTKAWKTEVCRRLPKVKKK